MVNHVHPAGVDAKPIDQLRPSVLRVDDDPVDSLVQPPLGARLPGPWLAWQEVMRGEHQRARTRQQVAVQPLHRQPLEMDHVGGHRAAVADHVGEMLGCLDRPP